MVTELALLETKQKFRLQYQRVLLDIPTSLSSKGPESNSHEALSTNVFL